MYNAAGPAMTSPSGIVTLALVGLFTAASPPSPAASPSAPAQPTRTAPVILYTDAPSGPTSGGENNHGGYLSIFGKNFGDRSGLGTKTKVFVGTAEVANYRYLGPSVVFGKQRIEQLTVQVGALGKMKTGTPAPVKVVVNGVASNTDQTFTPSGGRVLFVGLNGNDANAAPNDIKRPWRHLQDQPAQRGAYFAMRAGDQVVIRGGKWSDADGIDTTWMRFGKDATKKGTATGWIHITAHPGPINGNAIENVSYVAPTDKAGGIQGPWSAIRGVSGSYISVSNLHLAASATTKSDGAPINTQYSDGPWRIVNNELGPWPSTLAAPENAKAGGVAGGGNPLTVYGNYIHDIDCASGRTYNPLENHGIYIDNDGAYDIGWNAIFAIRGGNGVQTYNNGSGGSQVTNNVSIHHNFFYGSTGKHGVNIADGSGAGFKVFNNVITDTTGAGIRFNSTEIRAKIWNNTLFNVNRSRNPRLGALANDSTGKPGGIDVANNIIWPFPGTAYTGGTVGFGSESAWTNNLFYGAPDAPDKSTATNAVVANPQLANPGMDFRLQPSSPAKDKGAASVAGVVTNDFNGVPRPQGSGFDIGAFELP